MATYAVTYSEEDDWGDDLPARRYKYRSEADAHLADEQNTGRFARLIRWEKGTAKEMARVNEPANRHHD
jgi:hypothetical protein